MINTVEDINVADFNEEIVLGFATNTTHDDMMAIEDYKLRIIEELRQD